MVVLLVVPLETESAHADNPLMGVDDENRYRRFRTLNFDRPGVDRSGHRVIRVCRSGSKCDRWM